MKSVVELTDIELSRLILRKMWQIHDAGGISMGRSQENKLLEAVLELIPLPKKVLLDKFSQKELLKEADRRRYEKTKHIVEKGYDW